MGKILKIVAVIAIAAAVAYFAPQLSAALVSYGLSSAAAAAVTAVVAAVVTIAATAGLNALIPTASAKSAAGGGALQMYRQSLSASFIIYGKRRAGGLLAFYHPKMVGKTHYRYMVIAVAGHRCQGVTEFWLNDVVVTVDGSGKVTSGDYAGHAWLWFVRGTDTDAAHSTFVAECDGQWTTAHQGKGVAKLYAKFEMVDAVVQAGMPNMTVVVEGKDDIVDPRTGEEGYTRLATPIIYDWFKTPRAEGGFGTAPDEVPDDATLAAWTNICDEDLTTPAGSEKRYELDVWMTTGSAPSEVRAGFATCVAGTYAEVGGVFMLRPGYWNPVSHVLSEDDLAGPISIPLLSDPQSIATQVGGTFIDPTNSWQSMPVPPRAFDTADVVESDLDLPHITSTYRAQRINEIVLRRSQCEKRVTWPANISALDVSVLDTVRFDTSRYGLSNYAFVVDGWGLGSDFGVSISGREEHEEVYTDPSIYGTLVEAPLLFRATPIVPGRGAHVIRDPDPAYKMSSTSGSISITGFQAVLDDGTITTFPDGTITGLATDTIYQVFRSLGSDFYFAAIASTADALTAMASSNNASFGAFATQTSTGTYTPPASPPPGSHGGSGSGATP